jgi:DNA invertase Pin-like site-specific DNA recombinase
MKQLKVAIYVRTSTIEQNTEMQKQELTSYINSRSDWVLAKIYEDHGSTGTNDKRPQLQELLKDCRCRKVDVVVCWKLDRFFRSLKMLVNTLQELDELGVKFISLRDQIDL